jgi:hypothetical protein
MNLTPEQQREREHVVGLMMSAWTMDEVREAQAALLAWVDQHPDDWGILEGGEILSHREDFAREREEERIALGMTEQEGNARDALILLTRRAATLEEIDAAERQVNAWLTVYPRDERVRERIEYLERERELARIIADALREEPAKAAA